ncbi:hypothetical protein LguiB_031878 [Lonicera macranthoides]
MNEIASKALDETGAIHVLMIMAKEFRYGPKNAIRGAHFLYGLPNATWEIIAQARPDLPRPIDINFIDELTEERKDWLVIVASHCDEWLRSYCASSSGHFNEDDRIKPVISDIRKVQVAAPVSDDEEAPINEEVQQEQEADNVNPVEEALNEELQIEEPLFVEAPINAKQQQEQEADDVNPVEVALNEELEIQEPLFVEEPINAELEIQEPLFVEEEINKDLCYDCRVERDWMAGNKCVLMTSAMKDNSRCPSCRFKNQLCSKICGAYSLLVAARSLSFCSCEANLVAYRVTRYVFRAGPQKDYLVLCNGDIFLLDGDGV